MASIKTINFLPEVFRTDTNQKFLNATLDQLYTPPDLRSVNAYVGRRFAPTYQSGDNYQPEPSALRQNYQLEPSVVVTNPITNQVEFFSSYIDIINQLGYDGAITTNQSRLFSGENYSYNGLFDFDKFVNFNQYYWLTNGPDTVDIFGAGVDQAATYTVIRDANTGTYHFTGSGAAENPALRLGRGGTYKFIINQPGFPFWIQSSPGTSGLKDNQSNLSSRDILGITNNGTDVGTITFTVPQASAQNYYTTMPQVAVVDSSTNLHYNQIQGATIAQLQALGGLDGIVGNLVGKTFVFTNTDIDDSLWTVNSVTIPVSQRRNTWQIQLVGSTISLVSVVTVAANNRVYITSGQTYAEYSFYLDPNFKYYMPVPNITAPLSTIYYQDGVGASFVGQFNLVALDDTVINVDMDVVGKKAYTSPNGVSLTNGLKIQFDSSAVPSSYAGNTYYVEGVGTAIQLLPTVNFQTPEAYLNGLGPVTPDYITINRASADLNPWTRSNRWFHIDVIKAAATYNGTVPVFNQQLRANRAIIEFESNVQLYNFGRQAKTPVDIFCNDGSITDARNQVELQTYKSIMGVPLQNGQRIIFADDFDLTVKDQIFIVNISEIKQTPVITLEPASDAIVSPYNNLIVMSGTNSGIEYWYDGSNWNAGQQKTSVNQTPMFDVIDSNGISLGDTTVYPGSTFATTKNNQGTVTGGTPIFSYDVGTGVPDQILGFPLNYRTFTLSGDIQFINNFDNDTFSYTENLTTLVTANINTLGTLQQNTGLTTHNLRNVWTTVVEDSRQYQVISGVYDGVNPYFTIDVLPNTSASVPYIKVFKNFIELKFATDYIVVQLGNNYYIKITNTSIVSGDQIDMLFYSDTVSSLGYYQVPDNLNLNSKNANFNTLTLGQLRNHLVALVSNSMQVTGLALGDSNIRDLSIKAQGGNIVQNASPVLYGELFLIDSDANFLKGLELARHNYGRFKNKILELAANLKTIDTTNIPGVLDSILQTINSVKNSTFPWYYSDMVPYGPLKNTITYKVINPEQKDYEISKIFSDTTLSNRAVLVYVNGTQKTKGIDYVFDTTRAGITFNISLLYGDVITINDYNNTDGNYIPETPTKLGLYPKFLPEIYLDSSYVTPINVIQGHDGSITPAFGDYRDALLLEFELRIYNNIKVNYASAVNDIYNFQPGKFRTTDYTNSEFTQLLTKSFLQWVGNNRVDFTDNSYFIASDPFTWNYSRFVDTINGEALPGAWRAIYKYFYDTDRPDVAPWEMLGFSEQPSWWATRYGPAPFTGGNLVLWGDLAAGYVWNNGNPYTDTRFVRPDLLSIIPVDANGNLRNPTEFAVKSFNSTQANGSYAVGQQGPVETAWRRSSDFPYAMQQAIAMANPAYYFGTLMDVTRYYKNTSLNQYVVADTLQRITPTTVRINGESNGSGGYYRVAGYVNWIADYLTSIGINPTTKITGYLQSLNIQLAYKMAGFSDTSFLHVQAEQASPTSTTNSVIIPNENYKIELYKSTPTQRISYSAVVIEKSENGYTVSGYDTSNPYFTIIPSRANNNSYPITVLNDVGIVYQDYQQYKITVPYGFEFTNKQQVVDFLISYQRYLVGSGIVFGDFDPTLGTQRDFTLSIQEFLSWSQQGWAVSSIIVLSPILDHLIVATTSGVVDQIQNNPTDTRILDTGYNFIKYNNFTTTRTDNRFTLTTTSGQTIALAILDVVEYEHVLIFDNITSFSDVIYVPSLGNRQYRLKLVGKKTGSWTGLLNPPGFIYSNPNIDQWQAGTDYALGSLVTYKSNYYTTTHNLPAAPVFYANSWQQLTSNQIQTGLLPNFSYNAGKSLRYNDLNNPELQGDFSRFVGAEIGFKPRQYLTNFGIDITTQAKFYQGFIKQKGTMNAVTAFTAAGFNGITSNIGLYEEWAMRVGEYGALNNNQYVELQLVEGQYNGDPVTFTLLSNNEVNNDNTIGVYPSNLYLTGTSLSNYSPAIYTNRDDTSFYENDIGTAGYVNANDVDIQLFDMTYYGNLNSQLSSIGTGTKIWVAKDNITTQWNVYRVSETNLTVTSFSYDVDVRATVTVKTSHNFVYGDYVVIKGFDSRVDGVYQIYSSIDGFNFSVVVPSATRAAVQSAGIITGVAPIFKLQSVRLLTATDLTTITPLNQWMDGDKLWVDLDQNTGGWVVYNKSSPWTTANTSIAENPLSMQLDANSYISNSGFGTVSTINQNGTFAAASMPSLGMGNVIAFVSNVTNGHNFTMVANLGAQAANSVSKFGASLSTAGNLLYIGNPGNGSTEYGRVHIHKFNGNASFPWTQTLTSPVITGNTGDQFGYSVTSSDDGAWLYIGAPTAGNVYVYHANSTSYYSYANTITGNSYVYGGNAITTQFGSIVNASSDGAQVMISSPYETVNGVKTAGAAYVFNRSRESFVATGNTAYFTTFPITASTIKVTVNGNVLTSGYTSNSSAVTFTSAPIIGTTITVDTNKILLSEQLTAPTPTSGATFGIVAHLAGNDADVYVASPGYTSAGYLSGIVYRFVNSGANYGTITSTITDPIVTVGDSMFINGIVVTFGANATGSLVGNLQSIVANINSANIAGVSAVAQNYGFLTINSNVAVTYQKLLIQPGQGNAIANIGLSVYSDVQSITHSGDAQVANFGSQIASTEDSSTLIISASRGSSYSTNTFDQLTTQFDADATQFYDATQGSGAVYVYGLVEAALTGVALDQYVLVQELQNNVVSTNDQFGSSLALAANILLVGTPGDSNHLTTDPVSQALTGISNAGTYYTYNNFSGNVGWDIISSKQPRVDIGSITRMYIYDNTTNTLLTNFDYIDPAKGKILGAAQQDLDYITAYDPAVYNAIGGVDSAPSVSYNIDNHWGASQTTRTWWDIGQVRYYDYEQGNVTYRSAHWGETFPGSNIQVAEWVMSTVPPGSYSGPGQALYPDNSAYVIESYVNPSTKILTSRYYYWVINKPTVEVNSSHVNSIMTIQDIITNPTAQSIPYAAVLRDDTISLYNVSDYLIGAGNTTVFHADYDALKNTNIIHSEYQLVKEGNSESLIPTRIVNKLIDSLSGIDSIGNPVPATGLSMQAKLGLGINPNQTVFVDRLSALENFVQYVNSIFIQYPIVEEYNITNLYSSEPFPSIETYDISVDTLAELTYVDTSTLLAGYTVLVIADESEKGLWVTYSWSGTVWMATKVQSYYTPFYWSFANWYALGYNSSSKVTYSVNAYSDLQPLSPQTNDIAQVTNRGNGQYAIYQYTNSTWNLVGLEDGTIQLNENLYTTVVAANEIRIIFETIQKDIFINELAVDFNNLFFFLVNYILTEQKSVDWIFKTSFITIFHQLKKLEQFPVYIQDNQTYYEQYINEIKPYRTSIREYLIDYQGSDEYYGDATDFDIPATYISNVNAYRSPNDSGTVASDAYSLANLPQYTEWYNNYTYGIKSVTVSNSGTGYTITPTITVVGGGGSGANVQAIINPTYGNIIGFEVVSPGTGYTTTPAIQINGTGTGAVGYPHLIGQSFIDSLPIQVITMTGNATVYVGNIVTQPSADAAGTVYTASSGNTITLVGVTGTFVSNAWMFSDASNLQVRSGVPTTSLLTTAPTTVYTGNIITQANIVSGNIIAHAEVYTGSTGNVLTLWNTVGTFIGNTYLFISNTANLGVFPQSYTISSTATPVYSYTTFVDQSYNKVRTFDQTLKFDRVSYSSNIAIWQPNITVTANAWVSYDGQAYQSRNTVYNTTALKVSGNISANVGDYITQANNTSANARVISINSNLSLVTVSNITSSYIRRGGNLKVNNINANVTPLLITSIFDYSQYTLIPTANIITAADRITASYQPTANMPSTLAQVMTGIEYPGVQVQGVPFNAITANITSNVLYFYNNSGSLYSSNIAKLDFTTLGLTSGLPISIVDHTHNTMANVIIVNFNNNKMKVTGPVANISLGDNVSIIYYDYNNPLFMDSIVQSFYSNTALGTNPQDISIDGGAYYDTYSGHGPEELVPGVTFDNLNMSVYTRVVTNNVASNVGYRIVNNMTTNAASTNYSLWPQYYAIFASNSSTLSANLNLTDSNIHVTNANVFMIPTTNAYPLYPGIIFINGEKITYWTVDTVNNVLGQIRRAVDGTGAANVHVVGSAVVESSINQLIPTSANVLANVHTSSWLNLFAGVANVQTLTDSTVGANVIVDEFTNEFTVLPSATQEFIKLTSNVSVYPGNVITQPATGARGVVSANIIMTQANSGPFIGNTISIWAANASGTFGTTTTTANTYVYRDGANLTSKVTQISYTTVDGSGLEGSITTQAQFLRSRS